MIKKNRFVLILGSSNSSGDTYAIASYISEVTDIPIVDLLQINFSDFDYTFKNRDDDFFSLIEELINNYDIFILATPVYWYTMSAIMKRFLDRFSDLLKIHKETGVKLRGKKMAIVSCGSDRVLKEGFHMPFIETAKYLGMVYIGDVHTWISSGGIEKDVKDQIHHFIKKLNIH